MMQPAVFTDNQWFLGEGEPMATVRPFEQTIFWQGQEASAEQVDLAMKNARNAFRQWRKTNLNERVSLVKAYAEQLDSHRAELAETIAEETGKPLWEAEGEVNAMIGKIGISIEAYHQRTGDSITEAPGAQLHLKHRPHGVVVVFGPYNFPGHLPNGHIVPALLAGNTIVFKPSEQTPMTAALCVSLWLKAGLPASVLNLVQGAKAVGIALAAHPELDGLFFTGSSATGQILHRQFAGQTGKILALEMGGNNPLVIDDTVDRDWSIHHVLMSAFVSAGQRCTCARRLFIPAGNWGDQWLTALVVATQALKYGHYHQAVFFGPLISSHAANLVLHAQQQLIDLGGKVLLQANIDAKSPALVTPSIIDVTHIESVPDEEVFGPLLRVIRYTSFDQAIEMANTTRYGLSAGLLSKDSARWQQFEQDIRAGIVNWNKPLTGASSAMPFGGVGDSGNHRPSAQYAADYCAYPVATMADAQPKLPAQLPVGMEV